MSKRIFVGNLPFSATEEQLRSLFGQHGEVSSANIVTDRFTNRSRGFAFVEMTDDQSAAAAISALNGHNLDGRPLTVNEARERRAEGGPNRQNGDRFHGRRRGSAHSQRRDTRPRW
ncbi:MAG: RNA-binding protein [candidate division WOR-3 bacterium]